MPDSQYLSIGEVLGLLLEDFPDVTISKIRFLESQGLIEPERTPSGYRKFYDHDVDLLRAILHEQRENFLPLKVIRDRIESGGIQGDPTGARTPPRGIRNVDTRPAASAMAASAVASPTSVAEPRDSVFRRTDGGPEWAGGQALIPGGPHPAANSPITTAVAVVPSLPDTRVPVERVTHTHVEVDSVTIEVEPPVTRAASPGATVVDVAALIEVPVTAPEPAADPAAVPPTPAPSASSSTSGRTRVNVATQDLPFDRSELCAAAGITAGQLAELESYGLIQGRGSGADATYPTESVDIARVAARFLENGIDARHLRTWRQAAEREAALFEQRIMPLLRQRNPQSRQTALDTLAELAELGGQLRSALVHSVLRHHFDGT